MAYCQTEEKKIVDYIIEHDAFHRIKGDKLWKEMEASEIILKRSWQSLKEHFRKHIIYDLHLPRYNLDEKNLQLFREYFYRQSVKRGKNKTQNNVTYECTLPSSSDDDDTSVITN